MFEVLSKIPLSSIDGEVVFTELLSVFTELSHASHANLHALRRSLLCTSEASTEVLCGRWSREYGRNDGFRGGNRVEQACAEIADQGYSPAPIGASIVAELRNYVPSDAGRSSHISLHRLFSELPDPDRMDSGMAAIQQFINATVGKTHYVCLGFETSLRSRRAFFFGRATLLEIVPGSVILVVPTAMNESSS